MYGASSAHLSAEQRAETITCPVYRDGAIVAVTVGTLKLYNASGIEVATNALTFPGGVATATIDASTLDAQEFGLGWWAEWRLELSGVVRLFRNDAALVRARLYPTVGTVDTRMSLADYQAKLDEVDIEVQLRLIEEDNRPGRIFSPSAMRQVWLSLWAALIFEDLANFENVYQTTADRWRERYEHAWGTLTLVYDSGDTGQPDRDKRRSVTSSVWLMSRE